jgi:catechol 2,3-dioxygenase-like lactoylglutathione lyase family enzyme
MASTTPLITGVDFVCVPTSDHDRAVAFYAETLGLKPGPRWGSRPATEFQAGNLTLALMDPRGFGQDEAPRPNSTPIALQVDDVDAARAQLEARGVTFHAQFDSGVCHQAVFSDPDGNPLILHHRYAPKDASLS